MKINNVNRIKKLINYKIIPFGIIGVVALSGCGRGYHYKRENSSNQQISISDNNESSSNNRVSDNLAEFKLDKLKPLIDKADSNSYDISVNLDGDNYNEYITYLDSVDINYLYLDLYNIDIALNRYRSLKEVSKHDNKLSSLDSNTLLNSVKENNIEFKKTASSSYKNISDGELYDICNIIVDVCKHYLNKHKEISEERILCVLGDLKIFNKSSYNNAFVTSDNCLIIAPNMIDMTKIVKKEDISYKVLVHEINHLLQKCCKCEVEKNSLTDGYGFSYSFNDIEMNSMDYSWFYEASAEKNMANYINCEPITYKSLIGYLDSMCFVNILKDDCNIADLESLSFSRNIQDLYNYFGAKSEKEKLDVLKLMYTIQVLQRDPADFYTKYNQVYGEEKNSELIDKIRYQVKSSVCAKFSELFYRELAECAYKNNLTLGDIFYIISVYESDLNNHLDYTNEAKYDYNENFFENYSDIQNNFFYYLSNSMNIAQEELEELFNSYTVYDNNNNKKCSLEFMIEEKKEFIEYIENKCKLKSTYNIQNTYNYFKEKNHVLVK